MSAPAVGGTAPCFAAQPVRPADRTVATSWQPARDHQRTYVLTPQ